LGQFKKGNRHFCIKNTLENEHLDFKKQCDFKRFGYNKTYLRVIHASTIHFVLLPVGHLTSSITVPDVLTGDAAERLIAFQAIGALVGRLLQCGGGGAGFFLGNCDIRNKKIKFIILLHFFSGAIQYLPKN